MHLECQVSDITNYIDGMNYVFMMIVYDSVHISRIPLPVFLVGVSSKIQAMTVMMARRSCCKVKDESSWDLVPLGVNSFIHMVNMSE